jgi:hypothetical protein
VKAVELLAREDVWKWRTSDAGAWTRPLLDAALARSPHRRAGELEGLVREPALFLIDYKDGLRAACYMLNGAVSNWAFACKRQDSEQLDSCHIGPVVKGGRPLPHFDGLVYCIEQMFVTGKPVYPVERTLLSTGILALLFESKRTGRRVATPELDVKYRAPQRSLVQTS